MLTSLSEIYLSFIVLFVNYVMVFRIMASRPKRRRTASQTGETETQALGKECMTAELPIIKSVVKECLESRNLQQQPTST